jgi:type 2 lantibiotic biosynthesis protein LanM
MNSTTLLSPDWYRALTLTERLAELPPATTRQEVKLDVDLAERRMKRWRSQAPFTTDGMFAQRLATDGVGETDMYHILGERAEALKARFSETPLWLSELGEALSDSPPGDATALQEGGRKEEEPVFLNVVEPLLRRGREQIREGARTLHGLRPGPSMNVDTVAGMLAGHLYQFCQMMLSRTLVLELNVARLQQVLEGETPEERFRSFMERLRRSEVALAFFQEYPVLARQLTVAIDHWVEFSLEFLQHLCADWEAIRNTFSPGTDPGQLVQVEGGAGDTHRRGRSVMILTFSSGFRIVYKPRSLALDTHFQQLLEWINGHGIPTPFHTLKILDRSSHGWVEFVTAQECKSDEEVRRFYQRQGGYLALLYALEATDFHCENMIAAGEHPVLLDLEALFHPRLKGVDQKDSDELAISTLSHSVLRVGLLPNRLWAGETSRTVDISAMGASGSQLTPREVPHWTNGGTDEMRLSRKRVPMEDPKSKPRRNGVEVGVLDHVEALVEGFTAVYELLLNHREQLVSNAGPLRQFANDEVRVIARPTDIYSLLLQESFHPDVLRDALERDRLFDKLWVGVERLPHLTRVIPAERADLWQGDIPIFTTRPGSRDIWTSSNERLENFLDECSLTTVHHHLNQLNKLDLADQVGFIRASMATLLTDSDRMLRKYVRPAELQNAADRESLLAGARAAADRLHSLALCSGHQASWIGLTQVDEERWALLPLGTDLYAGLPGVTLFLAYLGAVTDEERYSRLARATLETIRGQVRRNPSLTGPIGAFSGWGGLVYAFAHLAVLWEEPALLREAEQIMRALESLVDQDIAYDVLGGAAGCLASLISLFRAAPSERALATTIKCGDHLIRHAQAMAEGVAWPPHGIGPAKPLTGFSHGTAGIAWALLELAAVTGEERFRKTALSAIAYERSVFSPQAGNWPDHRLVEAAGPQKGKEIGFNTFYWCHGAPGIGLSRLRALRHLHDPVVQHEVDTALTSTLAHGFDRGHSLCHGDLGNVELLLQAGQTFHEERWLFEAYRRAAMVLDSIEKNGWLCGNPLGEESPGLMTGLAGIGYGLLRLAEPERVPCVLTLDPPPAVAQHN